MVENSKNFAQRFDVILVLFSSNKLRDTMVYDHIPSFILYIQAVYWLYQPLFFKLENDVIKTLRYFVF